MSSIVLPGFPPSRHQPSAALQHAKSHDSLLAAVGRFARHPAASLGRLAYDLGAPLTARLLGPTAERRAVLYQHLKDATTYAEWRDAAASLDDLEGNNEWKTTLESNEYDHALVQTRLQELGDARLSCDPKRMLFLIRTALTRHLGNMGDVRLYKHSHIGTKHLIEKYIESTLETLTTLLDVTRNPSLSDLDSRHLLEQVLQARQSFGRSALLLSGGGTFGMNHIGVIKSLWDAKLLPRIISGSSAGSIVCSVLGTRTDAEVPQVMTDFCFGDLEVFTRGDEERLTRQLARFLKHGSLFDIANLQRVMSDLLGDMTFQEAYNRTRRILNICVSSASVYELPRLLNYITAPNVVIWSAVMSSCSVPLVFSPAPLLAKDPRTGEMVDWNPSTQCWIDGSVDSDLPMTRLAELFNVNHFIVSQVNPHVVPFLDREEGGPVNNDAETEPGQHPGPGWLHTVADIAKGEAMHRMQLMIELGIFPTLLTKTRSILSQKYSGDITILPEVSYAQFPNVLRNPTSEFMVQALLAGERATWPKLSRVQNHCAIELALDDAVQQLRARVAFSPSQVNLRLNNMEKPSLNRGSTSNVKQPRKTLKYSKSFGPTTGGPAVSPSASIDSQSSSAARGLKRAGAERPSLSVRRSFQHTLGSPSPDRLASEEEKMFSTTPIDSTDDEGEDYSEDTEDGGYFALSPREEHDLPSQLFPHASQPSSPLYGRRNSSGTPRPSTPRLQSGLTSALTMTMSNSPVSSSRKSDAFGPAVLGQASGSPLTPNTPHALDYDISGTRGMLMRKRKSVTSVPSLRHT